MDLDTSEDIVIDCDSDSEVEMEAEFIPTESNQTLAENKKNAGNEQYKAQNYSSALRLYSDAINLCPESPAFYGNRSACYMMMGDYKAALKDSRDAVTLDEKFEKGFDRIVKCCLALGDIVAAEQAIKKLMEIGANNDAYKRYDDQCKQLRVLSEKATHCYDKKDFRTVVFHSDGALKIAPACLKFKLLKAECLTFLGRIDQANDIAVSCMKSDSASADAVYVRGLCLYFKDNLDKGLTHFQQVLALDPDHSKARLMRLKAKNLKEKKENGNKLFKCGKFREAHAFYTEALEIDPLNTDINSKLLGNRALVNSKIGNIREAINDCTEALKTNPSYLKVLLLRAKCHNDMENYEECVKDYEAAFKIEKTSEIKIALKDAKIALKRSKRKDYYKILGIDKRATDDEIKKAYRKRALVHHPDRHASASEDEKREQEKKFKEVGEAYAILSDPQKKDRFDNGQDLEDVEFDPSQMYRQFFSFSGGENFGGQSFTSGFF